jgi:FKBP-type peptidyl-prolyl cis-trans isomerase
VSFFPNQGDLMTFPKIAAIGATVLIVGTVLAADDKDTPKTAATKDAGKAAAVPPKDLRNKASYAFGHSLGTQFKGLNFEPEALTKGLKDGLAGVKIDMTQEQIREILQAYEQEILSQQAAKNKKDGEAFLAENKKKPGVKTLPSGLQYKVIKDGTGATPKATDTVKANYRGTLIDGTEFDNSENHGGAASFGVDKVIPGWTEALKLMKVGSKWQLFIPANLAYGERGQSAIPPNSTLIFDVELVGIAAAPAK